MSIERFEKNLAEKFDDFSPKYVATNEMWDAIESELSTNTGSRKGVFYSLLFLCSIGIAVCCWSISFEKESNAMNATVQFEKVSKAKAESNQVVADRIHAKSSIDIQDSKEVVSEITGNDSTSKVKKDKIVNVMANSVNENLSSPQADGLTPVLLQADPFQSEIKRNRDFAKEVSELHAKKSLLTLKPFLISINELEIAARQLPVLNLVIDNGKPRNGLTKKDSRFSFGLSTGVFNLSTKYQLNDANYDEVLADRMKSEKTDIQYFAGIQLEYDLSEKWSIQSGLNFHHFQDERFNQTATVQLDTIDDYQFKTQTTTGLDTIIMGTAIMRNSFNSKTWKYTNRQLLSVPIMIVYHTALSEKSSLGIGLGFEKSIFTKIEGVEEDLNAMSYDLTKDKESRYGSNGANALLRLIYKYELTNKWDLRLESNYKHALLSNYNMTAPIEKSFNAFGVSVSTHLKF